MERNIDFNAYFENALSFNDEELSLRESILDQIPDTIIDAHTHASHQKFVDAYDMPVHIQNHMMSTFPHVDIPQSRLIDESFMSGKEVHKIRFAHVYPKFGQMAITEYIKQQNLEGDGTALFGLSDTSEDIDYTISELRTGDYSALKMYYLNSVPPKTSVYEYFPPEILSVAESEGVPIILHLPQSLYTSAHEAVDVAEKFPDLKIILAHVGVANVPKPELGHMLGTFIDYPNILVDTAMVDNTTIVLEAVRQLGSERILYGSDEPLNLMRVASFFNPDLQHDRVLTDYPYHWTDPEEQAKWRHLAEGEIVHNHWHQLNAILSAVHSSDITNKDAALDAIFSNNARKVFPSLGDI